MLKKWFDNAELGNMEIQGVRILIVDDDPAVQRMMRRILYRSGYDVSMAPNGQEAFESINLLAPDLILLDLSMPGLMVLRSHPN